MCVQHVQHDNPFHLKPKKKKNENENCKFIMFTNSPIRDTCKQITEQSDEKKLLQLYRRLIGEVVVLT